MTVINRKTTLKKNNNRLASPQNHLPLGDELIVDNFAGGGGASTGIEQAIGRPVDIAINHDAEAIVMHKANHPETKHYCEDVWEVDPREVTQGKPVGLAWFSPDCKHFSKAKGGRPVEKKIRGLAWVVIRWASTVRPNIIMLENVEEFQTWGPLKDCGRPCKDRAGETFNLWKQNLIDLGYQVEHREVRASSKGAATIRKRFYLIARCDGQPIVWPEDIHGPGKLPYLTAADNCIDWSIQGKSIFRERPLALNTMRRIARGMEKFVLHTEKPFIISYYGSKKAGGDFRGIDLGQPLPTQTTENRFGLVTPYITRIGHTGWNGADMSYSAEDPLTTVTSKQEHCLITPYLVPRYGERPGQDPRCNSVESPLNTIVGTGNQGQLVTPFIVKHFGGMTGVPIDTPFPTILARGTQNQIAAGHMVTLRNNCDGQSVEEPLRTITAGGGHQGVINAFLVKYYGMSFAEPIDKPIGTITSKDRFGLAVLETKDLPLTEEQRYMAWWYARFMEEYGTEKDDRLFPAIPTQRCSAIMVQDGILVDISMRMLEPRELYRAQGFPEKYIIDPINPATGKRLTKTAQTRMCGNSVCPPVAKALVEANYAHANAARQEAG